MTNSDFDGSVRATLADVALQTPVPDGLTDRLIANAEAGRAVVTPLHPTRRRAGWTLPLLAAAAIVVVAGGAYGVTQLADQSDQPKPPAAPTGPATRVPTAPPRPVGSAPTDFEAATASFRDQQHGDALGIGNCAGPAVSSCAVTLIATDDGGVSWHVLGVPSGLHSMFPTTPEDGSCSTNGDILGPCVDHVLFADSHHGYLFGLHGMYWTTDGGRAWHRAPNPPADSSGVPTVNNVPTMVVADGFAYRLFASHVSSAGGSGRLQRAPIGTNHWTDVAPADAGIYNSELAAAGNVLYLEAGSYAGHDATRLYRSTDHGAHWTRVGPRDTNLSGLAVAPNGAVAVSTSDCRLYVATDGLSFVRRALPGNCNKSDAYVAGMASAADLTVVTSPASELTSRPVRLYHSTDGGTSFQPAGSFRSSGTHDVAIGMDGDFGYLSLSEDRVYLTLDGGHTWQSRFFSN